MLATCRSWCTRNTFWSKFTFCTTLFGRVRLMNMRVTTPSRALDDTNNDGISNTVTLLRCSSDTLRWCSASHNLRQEASARGQSITMKRWQRLLHCTSLNDWLISVDWYFTGTSRIEGRRCNPPRRPPLRGRRPSVSVAEHPYGTWDAAKHRATRSASGATFSHHWRPAGRRHRDVPSTSLGWRSRFRDPLAWQIFNRKKIN